MGECSFVLEQCRRVDAAALLGPGPAPAVLLLDAVEVRFMSIAYSSPPQR